MTSLFAGALAFTLALACTARADEESTPRIIPRDPQISVEDAIDADEAQPGVPRLIGVDDTLPEDKSEPTPAIRQRVLETVDARDDTYLNTLKELRGNRDALDEIIGLVLSSGADEGRRAYAVIRDAVWGAAHEENRAVLGQALLDALPAPQMSPPAAPETPMPAHSLWEALNALAHAAADARERADSPVPEDGYSAAFRLQFHRDLLQWLGIIADDELIGSIAAYLPDPVFRDSAVAALARIPGAAAEEALIAALPGASPEIQIQISQALAQRGGRRASDPLVSLARTSGSRDVIWAALEALSALGDPPTVAVKADPGFTREEHARYAMLGIRAAQQLEQRGDTRSAERIYLSFMNLYSRRSHLRAALLGLGRLNSTALVQQAMGFMNTPGVRESAIEALASAQVAGLEDQLASAFYVTDPSLRAGILLTLHRRGSGQVPSLLHQALLSDSLELRVTAADIAGIPISDVDLLRLAREGNPWIRQEALRRYVSRAVDKVSAGKLSAARDPLLQIAQGPFPASERLRAIEALSAFADEEVSSILKTLTDDPAVSEVAYRVHAGMLSISTDGESNLEALESMAASAGSLEAASIAAAALERQGQLSNDFAARWGFITNWHILGPLPEYGKAYFAETAARPPSTVHHEETSFEWTPAEAAGLPAVLEFVSSQGSAWYARAEVLVPEWSTAELRVGSNGPCALWLNGEAIHAVDEARMLEADDDLLQIALQPGRNHILVKIAVPQDAGRFTARLTDRGGKAIDLTSQQMPDDGAAGVGTRPAALQETISVDAP
jgi:HEAT repeat protein